MVTFNGFILKANSTKLAKEGIRRLELIQQQLPQEEIAEKLGITLHALKTWIRVNNINYNNKEGGYNEL